MDISGNGLEVILKASVIFPAGIVINQFADDTDPLDSTAVEIAQTAMGLNGDMITWSTANPVPMVLNVVPGSEDDINLGLLAKSDRVGKGQRSLKNIITATVIQADGTIENLTVGRLTNAPLMDSVASAGRKKTKTYTFAFENIV